MCKKIKLANILHAIAQHRLALSIAKSDFFEWSINKHIPKPNI